MKYLLFFAIALSVLIIGCKKKDNTQLVADVDACSISGTVTLSGDVQIIFNKSCVNQGCHMGKNAAAGLNLESTKSLTSLNSKGFINTADPKSSTLYKALISSTSPMPTSGNLDACTIKKVLTWIEQGAQNN